MKIERGIFFDSKGADISPLTVFPLAELMKLREQSAAAEQTVFESLKAQTPAWEEQAGKTLLFDKAVEYAEHFKVNGQLLPDYTIEGEEIKQLAADIPAAVPRTAPEQETEQKNPYFMRL